MITSRQKMKTLWIFFSVVCLTAIMPTGVSAKIYQYLDKDGNKVFTENIADIPENQLDKIKTFDSVESNTTRTQQAISHKTGSKEMVAPDSDTWNGKIQLTAQQIEQKQEALRKINQDLTSEKKSLEETLVMDLSQEEKKEYKNRIISLNEKIQQYQQQVEALKSEIVLFNIQIGNN